MSDVARFDTSALPETVAPGSVLLVTGPVDPVEDALPLRLLHRYAAPEDAGIVVSTTSGVDETTEALSAIAGDGPTPGIGVVDTVTRGQNITAFHREVPTVFTPAPADLARVAVAIANLEAQLSAPGVPHLVVRSVTPFFENGDPPAVARGMARTFRQRSADGLAVLGVDFTAVEETTVAALTDLADGVVRIAVTESGRPRLELRRTTSRNRTG